MEVKVGRYDVRMEVGSYDVRRAVFKGGGICSLPPP